MNDSRSIPPELAARITAASALLADYQRAAKTADSAERAMWGARLADGLESLLDGLGGAATGAGVAQPGGGWDQRAIPVTARATPQKPPPRRGLRAVLAGAAPPGGPAGYPFSPAWEGQSRVLAGAARARPPSPGSLGLEPASRIWRGPLRRSPSRRGERPNYPPRPSVNIPAACIFTSAAVPARDIAANLVPVRRPGQPDPPRSASCVGRYHTDRQPKLEVQDTSVPTAGRSVPPIGLGRDGHGVPCPARTHRGAHLHTQANSP